MLQVLGQIFTHSVRLLFDLFVTTGPDLIEYLFIKRLEDCTYTV